MKLENKGELRILYPEEGCKLYSQVNNSYYDFIYLGINANIEDYIEISENDIEGYEPKKEVEKINKKIEEMERENINMLSTTFELDFRVFELECIIEDGMNLYITANTADTKGRGKVMALTQYEIAKKLILLGEYDRFNMEYKLKRYKDKGVITEEQYNELISLMDANDLLEI